MWPTQPKSLEILSNSGSPETKKLRTAVLGSPGQEGLWGPLHLMNYNPPGGPWCWPVLSKPPLSSSSCTRFPAAIILVISIIQGISQVKITPFKKKRENQLVKLQVARLATTRPRGSSRAFPHCPPQSNMLPGGFAGVLVVPGLLVVVVV